MVNPSGNPQFSHRYKNPPIVEAICEIRFEDGEQYEAELKTALKSAFQGEYDGESRVLKPLNLNVEIDDSNPPKAPQIARGERYQLYTSNKTRLIAFAQDLLSIHVLKPYHDPDIKGPSGWEEFRPRISTALDTYWQITNPSGASRVSLRYINKIVVPAAEVTVEDYLVSATPVSRDLPDLVNNFVNRVEYRYPDGVALALSQGNTAAPPGKVAFLVDLDLVCRFPNPVERSQILSSLERLRTRERIAFEAVVTDQAREMFDEDRN